VGRRENPCPKRSEFKRPLDRDSRIDLRPTLQKEVRAAYLLWVGVVNFCGVVADLRDFGVETELSFLFFLGVLGSSL
jgi:hypothetical protein